MDLTTEEEMAFCLISRRVAAAAIAAMTEARWGSSSRFQGLSGAHTEFARAVALTGRCWPGSFGDRVSSGIEPTM